MKKEKNTRKKYYDRYSSLDTDSEFSQPIDKNYIKSRACDSTIESEDDVNMIGVVRGEFYIYHTFRIGAVKR